MLFAGLVVLSNMTLRPTPVAVMPSDLSPTTAIQSMSAIPAAIPAANVWKLSPGTVAIPSIRIESSNGFAPRLQSIGERIRIDGQTHVNVQASLNGYWDGAREPQHEQEEEFAYVNREARREEARQELREEVPPLDYRRQALSEEGAREFGEYQLDLGGRVMSGKEVLGLLVTPFAVVEGMPPDPRAVDFAGFGRGEGELRELADREGFSYHRLSDVLRVAHRDGLIYRLHDTRRGRTYYGVPYEVRQALGLTHEPPAPAVVLEKPKAESAFARKLEALARRLEREAPKDELAEFVAEAAESSTGVLSLVESAHGTDFWDDALAVAQAAAEEGRVDKAELESVLRDL